MAFNWEQNAFLGYMVEQYEKERGNDIFGRPLHSNNPFLDEDDNDDDYDVDTTNLPWWER